ncbi:MAG TPA: DoxX family protein [Candidatus Paceibacterota bacterium]|nr:DoxX family protein [Candidatus Paceibacterota bacterium]
MTKTQKIIYYILLVLVSVLFLFSAFSKLTGNPMAEAGFTQAHLPMWFMYFIGIAEVCGVVGLWLSKFQTWAAYGLLIILAGAIVVTAIFQSVAFAAFPIVTAVVLGIILKLKNSSLSTN